MGTTVEELKKLYTKLGGKDKQVATFNQPGEVINAINELDIGGGGMPDVGPEDVGKVATVNDEGKWDAETPSAVPTVTPNPEGEATADLTKLGINDDIYGIPTGLPAVTAEDNGKIAKVIEGAWDKADFDEPVVIVNCTYRYDISSNVLPDNVRKNTIISWIQDKKIVYLRCNSNTSNTDWVYMTYSDSNAGWSNVYFTRVSSSVSGDRLDVYWCNIIDNIAVFKVNIFRIPAGGGLPEVTSSDNGKVLGVAEGAWGKVTLNSGGVYVISALLNSSNAQITFEKNISNIFEDVTKNLDKKIVIIAKKLEGNQVKMYMAFECNLYIQTSTTAYFVSSYRGPSATVYNWFTITGSTGGQTLNYSSKTINDPE